MTKQKRTNAITRPLWLFMAMLCIVLSGPSKKLLEVRFDRKVNNHAPIGTLINKKIKDGTRDKRQYLQSVVHAGKQSPGNDGQVLFIVPEIIAHLIPSFFEGSYGRHNAIKQQVVIAFTPLFLLHRRLQV